MFGKIIFGIMTALIAAMWTAYGFAGGPAAEIMGFTILLAGFGILAFTPMDDRGDIKSFAIPIIGVGAAIFAWGILVGIELGAAKEAAEAAKAIDG